MLCKLWIACLLVASAANAVVAALGEPFGTTNGTAHLAQRIGRAYRAGRPSNRQHRKNR